MSRIAPRKPIINRRPQPAASVPRKPGQPSTGGRVGTNAKGTEDGYLYVAGVKDPSKRVSEFRTEGDVCPVCHTDRQFNKNLRLLVSPCYHKMCESCIDRLFTLGPEPCPRCGRILRKVNFAHQTFEDLKVEKEVAVRRRMAEHFNKRRDDFRSEREYDDYLEEVEDLTFNLLNDIDLPTTEARIAEFQRKNASLIAANQEKAVLETLSQVERDEVERRAREERMRMVEEAERVEREEGARVRSEIVEALAGGSKQMADDIKTRGDRAKAARAEALAQAIPPSLAVFYQNLPLSTEVDHSPLSPSYAGPYVAIPYSDPDLAAWKKWYEMKEDYVDGRSGVIWVKEDKEGK
ncbi:MAG: TFIIH/NER complex subunit [Tremellales sp. Tagirdzhanova-0007]|nr:MAG: TFIIH/NER complex subunit [Tremellales sp. Tagirdzhanova-0007]